MVSSIETHNLTETLTDVKVEMDEDWLRELIVMDYLKPLFNNPDWKPDDFEGYFYIDKAGHPIFVVEQKKN